MKCPKCGNEIKEGHLYCGVCGEEIRIVPDFDAASDENIKISVTGVIDTANVFEELNDKATKEIVVDREVKSDNKLLIKALVIAGAVCAVMLIVSAIVFKSVGDYYSVDKQYDKAFTQFENGEYDLSVKTVKHALTIDADDDRLKLLLSDNYYMLGKYDESIAVLYELMDKYPDDTAIIDKIIKSYEAKGDTQAISKLLNESGNTELAAPYTEYIAGTVTFSHESGEYDEIIELIMTSGDGATVYYTLDGSEVTEKSQIYTGPVTLENGEYTVNAFSVNSKGVKSEPVSASYIIDYYKPEMPVIKTGTGKYNTPKPVEVQVADYEQCYYTIDGEEPTVDDFLYQGPVSMYIGTHTYKFAVITNKGVSSDVVSVEITLDLITLIDIDTAKGGLIAWMNASGKGNDSFTYKCEQAYKSDSNIYYIINEYSVSDSEENKPTGNHYAVDVLTGLTYRAILDKSTGTYTLEALI